MGRHEDEAECATMWLRLNAQQTADLRPEEFRDPLIAKDVARAIDEWRFYHDRTSVIYITPITGRAILRWSEDKGQFNQAHRVGAKAMLRRMFTPKVQPVFEVLSAILRGE